MKNIVHLMCLLACLLMVSSVALAQDESDELVEFLAEYIGDDEPGVVAYVGFAGDEAQGAYGLADLETGEALALDSLFRIASVTKPLVATIVLQLTEAGDIDLDAPIADYLPAYIADNVMNAEDATIRQMLQMTSGIFNYTESDAFDDAVYDDFSHMWTAEDVIEFTYGVDADFDAGTDYYYSNSNYILAQLIIESVTGNSLADELDERIFAPAGMDSCYLETADRFAEGIVRGYEFYDEFEDITEINDGTGLGDGGVVCSASDLAKFLPALVDGVYLGEDMLEAMFDTVDDGYGGAYGLGIGYDETEYGLMLNHDGATSGFQSVMSYLPDDDVVIVLLTNNFDSDIMQDLAYDILDYLFAEE